MQEKPCEITCDSGSFLPVNESLEDDICFLSLSDTSELVVVMRNWIVKLSKKISEFVLLLDRRSYSSSVAPLSQILFKSKYPILALQTADARRVLD